MADNGTPALFDEETISISVGEVNQAPALSSIPDQTVMGGQTVTFAATASDIDGRRTNSPTVLKAQCRQAPASIRKQACSHRPRRRETRAPTRSRYV